MNYATNGISSESYKMIDRKFQYDKYIVDLILVCQYCVPQLSCVVMERSLTCGDVKCCVLILDISNSALR